jgi:mRNA degradation ribonuclease J1/J2
MAFSLHTDSKGILTLVQHVQPDNVVLVHGETTKMRFLQERIQASLNIPCFMPQNGTSMSLTLPMTLPVEVTQDCLEAANVNAGREEVKSVLKVCTFAPYKSSQWCCVHTE